MEVANTLAYYNGHRMFVPAANVKYFVPFFCSEQFFQTFIFLTLCRYCLKHWINYSHHSLIQFRYENNSVSSLLRLWPVL